MFGHVKNQNHVLIRRTLGKPIITAALANQLTVLPAIVMIDNYDYRLISLQ